VKIEDGCDRGCAFCVIPLARGPVRSRPPDDILAEAESLIAGGYREIVLTGINMALYGSDFPAWRARAGAAAGYGIEFIVNQLNGLGGDFRIRLGSLEPTVIDAGCVKRLFPYDKLCHSLHLSMQSGSSKVLRDMGRRYDREGYASILAALRDFDPGYGVSTDVIAGFPGETEADFRESLSLVRQARLSHVHVFRYSSRDGTAAAAMGGQVPPAVKRERARRLAEAGAESARAFIEGELGAARRVLAEGLDPATGLMEGLTDNGIRVFFERAADSVGRFVNVWLEKQVEGGARGVVV
jgi:threonylcarbamoyladenosine tRNA methylthiotransferase MtaB